MTTTLSTLQVHSVTDRGVRLLSETPVSDCYLLSSLLFSIIIIAGMLMITQIVREGHRKGSSKEFNKCGLLDNLSEM